jgi:hypothetical protein
MSNQNLICITPPTKAVASTSEDIVVNPIGIVIVKMSSRFPNEIIHRVLHSYFRGDASDIGVIQDFLRGNVKFVKKIKNDYEPFAIALQFVEEKFRPPQKYHPIHFADLRAYPWELSTSSEEPLVSDPLLVQAVKQAYAANLLPNERLSKANIYNAAFGYNRNYVHTIKSDPKAGKNKVHFYPTTAHARSHLTKITDESKIRMVFGVPWLFLMIELMLLWPLFNWFRKGLTPIAWTYEIMNGGMNKINSLTLPNDLYLCLDWKQFDKRVMYDLIDKIHKMWSSWMDMTDYVHTVTYNEKQTKHSDAKFSRRIKSLWSWMSCYLKHMHIQLPDGSVWTKQFAGIASGMLQTQVLDSFINLLMLITILVALKVPLPSISLILGDDSLLIIRNFGSTDCQALLNAISHMGDNLFGAVVNTTKSIITNDPNKIVFLAYKNNNGIPTRDVEELLAKFVHPERKWDNAKVKARALGFAYANCGVDLRVHETCRDVFNSFPNLTLRESGSPFLRYYREYVSSYDTDRFPTRDELLQKLHQPCDRSRLDERYWPSWFFTSEY